MVKLPLCMCVCGGILIRFNAVLSAAGEGRFPSSKWASLAVSRPTQGVGFNKITPQAPEFVLRLLGITYLISLSVANSSFSSTSSM